MKFKSEDIVYNIKTKKYLKVINEYHDMSSYPLIVIGSRVTVRYNFNMYYKCEIFNIDKPILKRLISYYFDKPVLVKEEEIRKLNEHEIMLMNFNSNRWW